MGERNSKEEYPGSLVEKVKQIVHEELNKLDAEAYRLVINEHLSGHQDRVAEIRIEPTHSQAATVDLQAVEGGAWVDLEAGADTHLELMVDSNELSSAGSAWDGKLRAVIQAIVQGKFTETIWLEDDDPSEIAKSKSVLDTELGIIKAQRGLFGWGNKKVVRTYEPYC